MTFEEYRTLMGYKVGDCTPAEFARARQIYEAVSGMNPEDFCRDYKAIRGMRLTEAFVAAIFCLKDEIEEWEVDEVETGKRLLKLAHDLREEGMVHEVAGKLEAEASMRIGRGLVVKTKILEGMELGKEDLKYIVENLG